MTKEQYINKKIEEEIINKDSQFFNEQVDNLSGMAAKA